MSILVPLLIVLGLLFLAWGAFRMLWDTRRDKIAGGVLLIASVTSLLGGAVGLLVSVH